MDYKKTLKVAGWTEKQHDKENCVCIWRVKWSFCQSIQDSTAVLWVRNEGHGCELKETVKSMSVHWKEN